MTDNRIVELGSWPLGNFFMMARFNAITHDAMETKGIAYMCPYFIVSKDIPYHWCPFVIDYNAITRSLAYKFIETSQKVLIVCDESACSLLLEITEGCPDVYGKKAHKQDVDFNAYDMILILDVDFILRPKEGEKIRDFIQKSWSKTRPKIVFIDSFQLANKMQPLWDSGIARKLTMISFPVISLNMPLINWIISVVKSGIGVYMALVGVSDNDMQIIFDSIKRGFSKLNNNQCIPEQMNDATYEIPESIKISCEDINISDLLAKDYVTVQEVIKNTEYTICCTERGVIITTTNDVPNKLYRVVFHTTFTVPSM